MSAADISSDMPDSAMMKPAVLVAPCSKHPQVEGCTISHHICWTARADVCRIQALLHGSSVHDTHCPLLTSYVLKSPAAACTVLSLLCCCAQSRYCTWSPTGVLSLNATGLTEGIDALQCAAECRLFCVRLEDARILDRSAIAENRQLPLRALQSSKRVSTTG